jgi:hypothetical protein
VITGSLERETDLVRDAIVKVVGEYVRLRKISATRYTGLCPFHKEKTPSFSVSVDRRTFKCFGCGESGDIFAFIQKIENVNFRRAKELLASWAGVTLTDDRPLTPLERREYARRRVAVEREAATLAGEVANWERGLELFLLRHEENIRAVTAWLVELAVDPGELLITAGRQLEILRQSTGGELVRAYRELPEEERRFFTEVATFVKLQPSSSADLDPIGWEGSFGALSGICLLS